MKALARIDHDFIPAVLPGTFSHWLTEAAVTEETEPLASAAYETVCSAIDAIEADRLDIGRDLLALKAKIDLKAKTALGNLPELRSRLKTMLETYTKEKQALLSAAVEDRASALEASGATQMANDVRAAAAGEVALSRGEVRTMRKGRVTDLKKMLQSILLGLLEETVVKPSQGELNRMARLAPDSKGVPGVVFETVPILTRDKKGSLGGLEEGEDVPFEACL